MLTIDKIKGIIFDYGGTIDSNGLHWAEVIWKAYETSQVSVAKADFRNAFVYGERTLGKNPLVKPEHTFLDMLRIKIDLQLEWLKDEGLITPADASSQKKEDIAQWSYANARKHIDIARPILEQLAQRYPLVLVSNFYGNIVSVLKDFQLDHLFQTIVESAVVGIRKPDPAIFQLGIDALHFAPNEIVVVGDSFDKDIVPATTLGCQTIWLKSIGWNPYKGTETADAIITDFPQIKEIFSLSDKGIGNKSFPSERLTLFQQETNPNHPTYYLSSDRRKPILRPEEQCPPIGGRLSFGRRKDNYSLVCS